MPGGREHDGVGRHTVGLEVGGVRVALLTGVSGLSLEHEVLELREGGADGSVVSRQLPGRRKGGEVTLTRGVTTDRSFQQWARDASLAPVGQAVGTVQLVVLDARGQPVVTYALTRAWPRRLEVDGLEPGGSSALIERLVLVYESFERV